MKLSLQYHKQLEFNFSATISHFYKVIFFFVGIMLHISLVAETDSDWITVHQRPPIAQLQELDIPNIRITAIRFEHLGIAQNRLPLAFKEGETILFDLQIECLSGHWEQAQELTLEIRGDGPNIYKNFILDTGLCNSPGSSIYFQESITLPRYHINGDTTLAFHASSIHSEDAEKNLLFLAPVHITPALLESDVTQEAIDTIFSDNAIRLQSRFRLGKSATIELPVPESLPFKPRRLGIISRIEYTSSHRQGEQVCRIQYMHSGEVSETAYLRNGVHTGFGNILFYIPGEIALHDVPIFNTWESRVQNMLGNNYSIQLYYGILDLPEGPIPEALVMEYIKSEGILEVRDVLLLP